MPTLEQVQQQIKSLQHNYVFYTKKEIKYLPEILMEGEEIRAITSGFHQSRTVLATCTNRRVIFLDKGMFFGLRQWQMALDRIQSIDGNYTILFGTIKLWDGAAPIQMNMVLASTIDPFIKATRQAIDDFKKISFSEVVGGARQAPAPQPANVDVASQIERLASLKDAGHLTDEEFSQQKAKLLS